SKIQVEKRLEPGEGFFSELHHLGIRDRPISVKSNGYPDGTVDGILREERHRRDQAPSSVPAEVEAVDVFFRSPSALLPNGLLFLWCQSALAHKESGGATRHTQSRLAVREQHDRRSDVG